MKFVILEAQRPRDGRHWDDKGVQLVKDAYITESERQLAIDEYKDWMINKAKRMKLYLK